MKVIGIGEKKTPSPVLSWLAIKFIYIEILKFKNWPSTENGYWKKAIVRYPIDLQITKKDIQFYKNNHYDVSGRRWLGFSVGDVGSLLPKKNNPTLILEIMRFDKLTSN